MLQQKDRVEISESPASKPNKTITLFNTWQLWLLEQNQMSQNTSMDQGEAHNAPFLAELLFIFDGFCQREYHFS